MVNTKLLQLAQKIEDKTDHGELNWEETSNDNIFQVSFPKYSVSIERVPETEQTYEHYVLRLFNERNTLMDELKSSQAPEISLEEIFDKARRTALNVDSALDDLMRELDEPSTKKPSR